MSNTAEVIYTDSGNESMSPRVKRMLIAGACILGLLVLLFATASFWVNWWWYDSIGYDQVIKTRYKNELLFFLLGFGLAFLFIGVNLVIALRRTKADDPGGRVKRAAEGGMQWVLLAILLIASLFIGLSSSAHWETWQLAKEGGSFGVADPVIGRDVSFYVFDLPAYDQLLRLAMLTVAISVIAVLIVYVVRWGLNVRDFREFPDKMRSHLLTLAGLFLLLIAIWFLLRNYHMLYSTRGAVFGASYTDMHVERWANFILAGLSLLAGLLLVLNGFVSRPRLLAGGVVAWLAAALVLGWIAPSLVQRIVVNPNELNKEQTYVQNNIDMTRTSFGITDVTSVDVTGVPSVSEEALANSETTLANIRLWDYRVARQTFQQLQSFVPYYVFHDLDVDRYFPEGTVEQVLVGARELDQSGLPSNSQTWTNKHLVYTHGYGMVISPVSAVSEQGLPSFIVGQIPPTGEGVYEIAQPEIYFGEISQGWVIVGTNQPEFSGISESGSGEDAATYQYDGLGAGSIELDSYFKRVMLALDLGEKNLLFSGALTDESRLLFRRDIAERVGAIAPFLEVDSDPYMVIVDGKLYWIVDAYTTSSDFPNANRHDGINYIRNSVKVVIDAYNGNTTLYRTSVPDPIADAWDKVYGNILTPIDQAPAGIVAHFKYPEDLFEIQSDVLAAYHVTDPVTFYNGDDRWAIPTERLSDSSGEARMEAYYVTMNYPTEDNADFTLIRPFIPGGQSQRQNMTAWMGGRTDETGLTELRLYRFPRQVTVFGPTQVAARIDQEPEISSQISLWNRSGSNVIRGNLLVIPLQDTILYVQPLYLQAANNSGALPELKRVIVASQETVVMRPTLEEALSALTQSDAPVVTDEEGNPSPSINTGDQTLESLAAQALDAYNRGQEALKSGDWTAYAAAQIDLQQALLQMQALNAEAVPAATPTPSE